MTSGNRLLGALAGVLLGLGVLSAPSVQATAIYDSSGSLSIEVVGVFDTAGGAVPLFDPTGFGFLVIDFLDPFTDSTEFPDPDTATATSTATQSSAEIFDVPSGSITGIVGGVLSTSAVGSADAPPASLSDTLSLADGTLLLTSSYDIPVVVEVAIAYALAASASVMDAGLETAESNSSVFASSLFGGTLLDVGVESDDTVDPTSITVEVLLDPFGFDDIFVALSSEGNASAEPPAPMMMAPEPGTLALLGVGLVGLAGLGRRRSRVA